MTLEEFLEALSQTPREWKIDKYGRIRLYGEEGKRHCPISAVINCWEYYSQPLRGGTLFLELSREDSQMIINAADSKKYYFVQEYRRRILQACGLKEDL